MSSNKLTPRRGFLGQVAVTAVVAGLPWRERDVAAAQQSHEDWIGEVSGSHKCFFDFPNHKQGFPLVHIFNYISTYASAYGVGNERVGTVGTFYGGGPASSIFMGFNNEIWSKYKVGEYAGLEDSEGQPYTRNVFNRPTSDDSILLARGLQAPTLVRLRLLCPWSGLRSFRIWAQSLFCATTLLIHGCSNWKRGAKGWRLISRRRSERTCCRE